MCYTILWYVCMYARACIKCNVHFIDFALVYHSLRLLSVTVTLCSLGPHFCVIRTFTNCSLRCGRECCQLRRGRKGSLLSLSWPGALSSWRTLATRPPLCPTQLPVVLPEMGGWQKSTGGWRTYVHEYIRAVHAYVRMYMDTCVCMYVHGYIRTVHM